MLNKLILFLFAALLSATAYSQEKPAPSKPGEKNDSFTVQGTTYSPIPGSENAATGGVLNYKANYLPSPVYPPTARAVRAWGAVLVQVLVNEEGTIVAARAISGHLLLQMAAVNAAKQARFLPTRLMGQPVKVSGVIVYNFVPGSPENTILGLGYDLVTSQISRSNNLNVIERYLPENWTEERALIRQIITNQKNEDDLAAMKPQAEEPVTAPEQPVITKEKTTAKVNVDPPDFKSAVNKGPDGYKGPVKFTVKAPVERFLGPSAAEGLARLQTMIEQRLGPNQPALWYFRYGRALGKLRSEIDDDAQIVVNIADLENLATAVPETFSDRVLTELKVIQEKAGAARVDPEEKAKLLEMLAAVRNERKIN